MVGFVLKIKASYAEQKGYQEIQKIRDIYYDPFERQPDTITSVPSRRGIVE